MCKLKIILTVLIGILFLMPFSLRSEDTDPNDYDPTPEICVQRYIELYLQGYEKDVFSFLFRDGNLWNRYKNHMRQVPRPVWKEESNKMKAQIKEQLDNIEQSKRDKSFLFKNALRINERGGHLLFSILHPDMKYKIIDKKDDNTLFLEVNYEIPKAPVESGGKYVRSAIVRVLFVTYMQKITRYNTTKEITTYKVAHYEPTDFKLILSTVK